jgi:hypothetical protein
VAAAVAAALGGCTGIGSTPTAATTSACDAARAAFQAGINTLPTPAPSSDAAQMGQYRTQLGSALQIVVGNPTCFDPQLVGTSRQVLAELNKPTFEVPDSNSFFR